MIRTLIILAWLLPLIFSPVSTKITVIKTPILLFGTLVAIVFAIKEQRIPASITVFWLLITAIAISLLRWNPMFAQHRLMLVTGFVGIAVCTSTISKTERLKLLSHISMSAIPTIAFMILCKFNVFPEMFDYTCRKYAITTIGHENVLALYVTVVFFINLHLISNKLNSAAFFTRTTNCILFSTFLCFFSTYLNTNCNQRIPGIIIGLVFASTHRLKKFRPAAVATLAIITIFAIKGVYPHSFFMRSDLYRQTTQLSLKHPIIGHGAGGFERQFPTFRDYTTCPTVSRRQHYTHPHNNTLWNAVDFGWPWAVTFLFVVAISAFRAPIWIGAAIAGMIFHTSISVGTGNAVTVFLMATLLTPGKPRPTHTYIFPFLLALAITSSAWSYIELRDDFRISMAEITAKTNPKRALSDLGTPATITGKYAQIELSIANHQHNPNLLRYLIKYAQGYKRLDFLISVDLAAKGYTTQAKTIFSKYAKTHSKLSEDEEGFSLWIATQN